MNYRRVLNRRTFLRGTGGVVIGLPFLDEMMPKSAWGQPAEPPVRAFNVFFGLGYQRAIQEQRMSPTGGLLPIQPLLDRWKSKLAFLSGVNQTLCNGEGNAHYDGSSGAFTGTPADRIDTSWNVTGGASIDQALLEHAYPNGLPVGMSKALNTGTWFRYSDSTQRYIHSRNANGQPAGDPVPPQTPRELFATVFGAGPGGAPAAAPLDMAGQQQELRKLAMRRSVLDSVMGQYQHFMSPAGNLGKASQVLIGDHLDHVRALELEVSNYISLKENPEAQGALPLSCSTPEEPGTDFYPHRNNGDGGGIDCTVEGLVNEVRLMARLFAQGVACDRVRFGSFVFQSGGERIRLRGRYDYNGETIAEFNDAVTAHEYWHREDFANCRRHLHMSMDQIAYFLEGLDGIMDVNGKTVLDNALTVISTESGSGVHRDPAHELTGVLHILAGGNGRFKLGGDDFIDVDADGIDLYNTILASYGVPPEKRLWDGRGDVASKILL